MNRRKFLAAAGASLAGPALLDLQGKAQASRRAPQRPNIIVIICDDLGHGDLGCYGSNLSTPHLDQLAREGVRLTHHTTPHPICSASRAALLTGLYPTRVNTPNVFWPLDNGGMSLDAATLGNVMQSAGYETMAIGKWHLGDTKPYLPTSRGFDDFYGVGYSVDMDPLPLLRGTHVAEPEADRDQLTQQYTAQAVEFIGKPRGVTPFFLYFAHSYPHIPLHASPAFRGKSPLGLYGDVVHEIDWSVGAVLEALRARRLEENTLVIFTSDHGPWYQGSTGDLRGRKGTTYEGGVRIPFIARLPGALPAGRRNDVLTSHLDLLPTLARLSGARLPAAALGGTLDGIDIWGVLQDGSAGSNGPVRPALLNFSNWNLESARWNQWKLHLTRASVGAFLPAPKGGTVTYMLQHPELYNVVDDPKESYDVAAQYPDVVAGIQRSVAAQMAALPERVQNAWAEAGRHPSSQWMADGSYNPAAEHMKPDTRGYLTGPVAAQLLQRYQ
jgi:arylsulfatase